MEWGVWGVMFDAWRVKCGWSVGFGVRSNIGKCLVQAL